VSATPPCNRDGGKSAAGSQYVIVKGLDAADLDPVRLFAEEVMPAFRGRGGHPSREQRVPDNTDPVVSSERSL
jgi:hypothetical protein